MRATWGRSVARKLMDKYQALINSYAFAAFVENKLNVIALVIILLLTFCAVFAPILAPYDPAAQHIEDRLEPPSAEYPLGTDQLGRDLLSRMLFGARISMSIAIAVVTISLTVGTIVGLVAGYVGGLVDEVLMRLVDILLAFPGLLFALVVASVFEPSLMNIMIALAVVGWTQYARVIRGSVLSIKEQEFVTASQLMGTSHIRILGRHILPSVISPVIVLATLDMAYVILGTAGLSFLGLGAQPPTPEWGTMLSQGRNYLREAWWIANFPGLLIMLTVLAFNILGDSLRDFLDPREASQLEGKGGL